MAKNTPPTRWFDLGTKALQKKFGNLGLPVGYMCPLCLVIKDGGLTAKIFQDPKGLTEEHVPPKSIGGKAMLLTCSDCNSPAGHTVDAHLSKLAEDLSGKKRGKVAFAGGKLNASIDFRAQEFTVSSKQNHPEKVRNFLSRIQKGTPINIESEQVVYDSRRARVSLLRAGYLAAFATLGYSYILKPSLEIVRVQIRSPDSDVIEVFGSPVPGAPMSTRKIGIVVTPENLNRAVVVQMGPFLVLLPPPSSKEDFYDQIKEGMSARMETQQPTWPKGPALLYDFS